MEKTQDRDEWKELWQRAMKVANKHTKKLESKLTKESRKAIIDVETAAKAEAKRAKASILKLAGELEANGKKAIKSILSDLEKDPAIVKASKPKKAAKSRKARKKKA